MKIVFLVDWHSAKMGYSDNFLPKAIAALGHEVHLVTSERQVYYNTPNRNFYKTTLEPFLGPGIVECGQTQVDGYYLHRLPSSEFRGRIIIHNLADTIRNIQPDILQTGEFTGLSTYQAALLWQKLQYKFFIECHTHASVFPWAGYKSSIYWGFYSRTMGTFINNRLEKCYPISSDSAEIVNRCYGVDSAKIVIRSLGVDTELFSPVQNDRLQAERLNIRKQLGLSDSDIACIYTGRFTADKDPLCLVKAVALLRNKGKSYYAILVGNGSAEYRSQLESHDGVIMMPFVPVQNMPALYRAVDIAVWPRQESTSQLDAAACGLPLILSNRVKVRERVNGNGLLYKEGDYEDLAQKLDQLSDEEVRQKMGETGVQNMREKFSWQYIAAQYARDYELALNAKN